MGARIEGKDEGGSSVLDGNEVVDMGGIPEGRDSISSAPRRSG